MEMLSWMRKVDAGMENRDLLELIDNMHEVIDALMMKNKENEKIIGQLKEELNK
ncbi:MAG: hypothetical protein JJT76_17850 [Clostridiaceae bacterium]|nr:hypothetical protein [Clostridiaceae bacterium]